MTTQELKCELLMAEHEVTRLFNNLIAYNFIKDDGTKEWTEKKLKEAENYVANIKAQLAA